MQPSIWRTSFNIYYAKDLLSKRLSSIWVWNVSLSSFLKALSMVIQSWVETIWLVLSNLKCEPPSSLMFSPVFPLCCFYPSACSLPYLGSSGKDLLFCLTLGCIPIVACEKFYYSVSLCLFPESCLNSLHFVSLSSNYWEPFRLSSSGILPWVSSSPPPPIPGHTLLHL